MTHLSCNQAAGANAIKKSIFLATCTKTLFVKFEHHWPHGLMVPEEMGFDYYYFFCIFNHFVVMATSQIVQFA